MSSYYRDKQMAWQGIRQLQGVNLFAVSLMKFPQRVKAPNFL